jgi:hypothetical protein
MVRSDVRLLWRLKEDSLRCPGLPMVLDWRRELDASIANSHDSSEASAAAAAASSHDFVDATEEDDAVVVVVFVADRNVDPRRPPDAAEPSPFRGEKRS